MSLNCKCYWHSIIFFSSTQLNWVVVAFKFEFTSVNSKTRHDENEIKTLPYDIFTQTKIDAILMGLYSYVRSISFLFFFVYRCVLMLSSLKHVRDFCNFIHLHMKVLESLAAEMWCFRRIFKNENWVWISGISKAENNGLVRNFWGGGYWKILYQISFLVSQSLTN